ncbi:zinc-binding dehydrogenase [Cutibacterium equinum]|uniref:Zinc-binding dehydrogenase n=1 Tax=Cutibacterium equinum TaxID=3016342 RepID=A0ABY7QZ93_9ACTN|nr:zinc-binding dehydrogenase [Cutibacterium equinum]WCC80346.1 zinc-binding dehydrogenase [Cutibacterium equinum]
MDSLPTTMRAAVLRKPGEPLVIETLNVPRPRHGEVLLKVIACGLCHSDLHVLGGAISFPVPAVLGHEVSGVIVELGDGLDHSGLEIGQRVSGGFLMPCGECEACRQGRDDLCGPFFEMNRLKGTLYDGQTRLFSPDGEPVAMYSMGALAQYCVVPATAVVPLPAGLDPLNSAILGCAAMTAYGAVRRGADLRYGESVAVVATGGVGSNILQVASAMGADPIIAIDVKDEKLAEARSLGATHTVNSVKEDARRRVLEITGGRGVQIAFEALGIPATWTTALDVLADGGRMVPVGLGAGVQTAGVEINRTVRRGQSILGSYGARTRVDLPAVVAMAARGIIDVDKVVNKVFSLDEVNEGYAMLRDGAMVGRGVIDMSL